MTPSAAPIATSACAIAQPLSTRASRWTGRGTTEVEQAGGTEGPVTPAVIWAPLFAGSLAYAVTELRRTRSGLATAHAAGWWANAALAGNVAWSLNAQFRCLDEVSVALILASASASASASAATTSVALAERAPARDAGRAVSRYVAPLAGWLCVAGFANIETTRNLRTGGAEARDCVAPAVRLLAAAAATGSAVAVAVRGNPRFALAACWGLAGTVVKAVRHRQTPVATAAGAGALAIAGSSLLVRRLAGSTATGRRPRGVAPAN